MHQNFKKQLLIKLSLAVATLFVIAAGISVLAYDTSEKARYIMITRSELNSRLKDVNQLSLLKVSFAEAEPYLDRLKSALPNEDSLLVISGAIENVAKERNLGHTFKFSGAKQDVSDSLRSINFLATAQGDYGEIINFIKDVEDLPYFIKIVDADITSQQSQVYNSSINGTIYFNG